MNALLDEKTVLRDVDATTLKHWLDQHKALLIDIREPDEYAREHILGARLVPLSGFDAADFSGEQNKVAVFHCGTGMRTCNAAAQLLDTGFKEVYQLKGGLSAWKQAGLATHFNRKAPISLMRQVQLIVGFMVLLGVGLGFAVSPWFTLISAFFGGGLFFAGATGTCALAAMLGKLPYNRLPTA